MGRKIKENDLFQTREVRSPEINQNPIKKTRKTNRNLKAITKE